MANAKRPQLAVVATAAAVHIERWQWCQVLASEYGPPSATTRHVLHVLALFMNPGGGGCWPSQSTIARRCALTSRAVKEHLALAKRDHWLDISEHHYTGQGWRRNSYTATVPANVVPLLKGGEPDSPGFAKRGEPNTPTWGTRFTNVGNQVPPNLSGNSPMNKSEARRPPVRAPGSRKTAAADSNQDELNTRFERAGKAAAANMAPPAPRRAAADSDEQLAEKVRKLREIGLGDGDIERTLKSVATKAQLSRVLKTRRRA